MFKSAFNYINAFYMHLVNDTVRPLILILSTVIVTLLLVLYLLFSPYVDNFFSHQYLDVFKYFNWFFILSANAALVLMVGLLFTKYSKYKIGGSKAKVEFSNVSWYAMLFAAGMGTGLVFNGVYEPASHYSNPMPYLDSLQHNTQATNALVTSYLHWGLHPWAIYAVVALILAVNVYQSKLPLSFRSVFYPIFKQRIYGRLGDVIDSIVIVICLTGIISSLGIGLKQIAGGVKFLFSNVNTLQVQIYSFIAMFVITLLSVVSGINKGIKILSSVNILVAIGLLVLLFIMGPTAYIVKSFFVSSITFVKNVVPMSIWIQDSGSWQIDWTVMYWAWWFGWSPFVGAFIANISKGRTIREFIVGVVLIPSLASWIWMSVLGGNALWQLENGLNHTLADLKVSASMSLFYMLNGMSAPMVISVIISVVVIFLLVIFFITSADSAALIISKMSAIKDTNNNFTKFFWVVILFAFAFYLIFIVKGGSTANALQNLVVLSSLPLILVIWLGTYGLLKSFKHYK